MTLDDDGVLDQLHDQSESSSMLIDCDSIRVRLRAERASFVCDYGARSAANILDATLDTIAVLERRNGSAPSQASHDWSLLSIKCISQIKHLTNPNHPLLSLPSALKADAPSAAAQAVAEVK